MKFKPIIRKLNLLKEKYITSDMIKDYCSILDLKYYDTIIYLTRNKYLYTIFKGIFYVPSITERKLKSLEINHYTAIQKALEIKGIKNWYFGFETAFKFNNITHEFFVVDYVISDTIARARTMNILGNKVKFIKMKKELFKFGIKKRKDLRYSDIEKTALDIIYISRYNGLNDKEIINKIKPILGFCSKAKLRRYAKSYNKKIEEFISGI